MRLRARLIVATAVVAVPMVIGLIWLDARSRHHAAEARLAELTRRTMHLERARCEASPATWGGHPQPPPGFDAVPAAPAGGVAPPVSFPYDASLASRDPRAPRLGRGLLDTLGQRDWIAVDRDTFGAGVTVLVRMPWTDGPCALILTRGTTTPGFVGAILPAGRVWLLALVAVLAAVLLAVGPVIARIRRLTGLVRAASARGFADAVLVVPGTDEVGELSRAFAAACAAVTRELRGKDDRERALREFLANTTHDVMIPLTVLTQHLAVLRDRTRDPAAAEAALAGALDEVHYLAALLHNLAATAKLDVAEPRLERGSVQLDLVIARVVARHRVIAIERGVELDSGVPEAPVRIDADLTMIEQAVSNVVYNAIRHNRRGGHVAISLDRSPGRFELRVLDDGPGIPPEQLGQMSVRGFRGDAARGRNTGGQGIGLHITHSVARLHGFDLTFTNRDGGGLEVVLAGPTVG